MSKPFPHVSEFDLHAGRTDHRAAAQIAVAEDGGPVRTIINGRQRKPVGRYASRKAGRSLPWEAREERMFFWLCEADPEVVGYLSQPHRLTIYRDQGRPLVFYPDVRRELAGGRVEIVEVKKTFDARDRGADPDYALKLELARQVYAGLGWDFRLITGIDMRRDRRLATAKAIQRHRGARFDGRDRMAVLSAIFQAGGRTSLKKAAAVLGDGPRAYAMLKAIIVCRVVQVDLNHKFEDGTELRAINCPDAKSGGYSASNGARDAA